MEVALKLVQVFSAAVTWALTDIERTFTTCTSATWSRLTNARQTSVSGIYALSQTAGFGSR